MMLRNGRLKKGSLTVVLIALLVFGNLGWNTPSYATASTNKVHFFGVHANGKATLSWDLNDENVLVRLYRDGSLLEKSRGSGTFEDQLAYNETASYVVDLSRTMQPADTSLIQDPEVANDAMQSPDNFEVVDEVGFNLGQETSSLSHANASPAAATTTFRYQTFIPDTYIQGPITGCYLYPLSPIFVWDRFWGDARSYNPTSTAYRTRLDANINWSTGKVSGYRDVGTTHVEIANLTTSGVPNGTYRLYAKTASNTTMAVTDTNSTTSVAHFTMKQNVADPYCVSNGIYVDISVNVARSGGFSMFGTRIQVPNHEVYVKDSDTATWTTVLKAQVLNYWPCLMPTTPCNTSVSTSGSR